MPKIYEYFGLVFLFYAREHEPIHVHVRYNEFESKVEFSLYDGKLKEIKFKTVTGRKQLPIAQRKEAEIFINHYFIKIVKKWADFYLYKKEIKSEKVTRRLK